MANKKEKPSIDDKQIFKMLSIKDSFNSNIKGIKKFISHLTPVVKEADKIDTEAIIAAVKLAYDKSGVKMPIGKEEQDKITDDQKKQIYRNLKVPELKSPNQGYMLWKGNFVFLISGFEYLFADIITFYFRFYPQNILDKTIEVDLADVKSCSTIDEYIDVLIAKKVETILYRSIDKQIEFIEKELKLDLETKIIDWDVIKEAILRRHLIVHNASRINKRYLKEVSIDKLSDLKNPKEGDSILIGPTYFNRIYQEVFLAGNIIIQNCFRKWLKKYEEYANLELIDLTYEGNFEKEYVIAEKIGLYGRRYNAYNNDFHFRINVNYCLALKAQGKKEELHKEISLIDISNLSPIYIVAYYALLDDKKNTLKHLRNAKTVDKLEWFEVEEWPLFENLRKDEDFLIKASSMYKRNKSTKPVNSK
jgi:hypothetical protein